MADISPHIRTPPAGRSSIVIDRCQVCDRPDLAPVLFLGYLPPVNQMAPIGEPPGEQPAYPAQLLFCANCSLAQLGLAVDPKILFPPEYPYTSGTTRILRDNFSHLFEECRELFPLRPDDLIVDIGSNDGTLLSNFQKAGYRVHGVEPTLNAETAASRGIPTTMAFFNRQTAEQLSLGIGPAQIVTATNVFAHIPDVHEVVRNLLSILDARGVFVSEAHYLPSLIESLQYDTIYHEHLRYYSLQSLKFLFNMHGLDVIHARRIPTHGGSLRVYAARKGHYHVQPSVPALLDEENKSALSDEKLREFRRRVLLSKLELNNLLLDIRRQGLSIYGIGAPSRASTLIHYVGLDDGVLECVVEVSGSRKIGKYMPGTLIPVVEESLLFERQPAFALVLSWHIAGELIPNLVRKGYRGRFLVPLPVPRILSGSPPESS